MGKRRIQQTLITALVTLSAVAQAHVQGQVQATTQGAEMEPIAGGISLQGERPEDHFSFSASANHEFKCFETSQELRAAVRRYEGYNVVDIDLAKTYGWPIGNWCTSKITDFSNVFARKKHFKEPLTNWDLSNGVTMQGMFQDAWAFNQPVNHWDVSSVTDMSRCT
jgi:surface protein